MALELKKKSKIYLKSQKVGIEDNSPESAEFFGVVDFPKYLGEGKNSFKIRPVDGAFLPNTKIEIEVLDSNERPIYWEIPKYKEEDKGRLISVWIYDLPENRNYNTPNGTAQIILLGTLPDGNLVRWSRKIDVNKSRKSVSNIVFNSTLLPRVNVSSSIETFTNKKVSNSKLTKTIANSEVYYKKSTFGDTTTLEHDALSNFNAEMVGGTVYAVNIPTLFPRLGGGQPQPTQFTGSITEVASSTIMRINTPITASDNRSDGSIHTYEYSDGTLEVNIEYYSTGSDTSTQNQIAFANFTLTNVKPIVGRIDSINTLIKSQGLTNADYDLIGNTKVENTPSLSYKVPIPTEHLKDPKSLKLQFLNSVGEVSSTELVVEDIVFEGGNVYIDGDQSLISGSFHIGNAIGTGIEMAGHSSGYLKSIGYNGFTSASLGKGAGGFLIWSGSGNLQLGDDQYPGVGMEMVSEGGSSSFYFTTHDGGQLKVITDEFFIGTDDTQFISGSGGNIEISSSFFHLNPKDSEAVIGGFVITPNAISSSNDLLILKSNGHITASAAMISGSDIQVYTPNFTIDASGNVSANRAILEDTARADSFTYTYTGIQDNFGNTNFASYIGTYSGSDGKLYSYLDLSGVESKLDPTTTGASFIRLSSAPTYPIGAIIHPFAYGETAGYSTGNTGMQVTIECATADIRFAFGASVGSGTGKQQFDYTGSVVYTDPKSSSTLFRSYINSVSGFYNQEYLDTSVTIGAYTYNDTVWTVPASTTISFARGFFAWQVLYSSRNNNMTVGNLLPFTDNTYDIGSLTKRFDDVYATNGTIQTSDVNQKTEIHTSDLGLTFVNSLRPVSYKFKDVPAEIDDSGSVVSYKTGSRTHYGLIAQELSSSLGQFGKTTLDFAGITTGSLMGLRYTELISPMIKAIQELSDEVNQLKFELSQSRG